MNRILSLILILFVSCEKSVTQQTNIPRNEQPAVIAVVNEVSKNEDNKSSFLSRVQRGDIVKIACQGTSLTYGHDTQSPDRLPASPGIPVQNTRSVFQYPSTLKDSLTFAAIVVNRGYSADKAKDGLIRWKDSIQADVVILEYGTNEALRSYSIETFKTELSEMIERHINQGSYVIVCMPPFMNNSRPSTIPFREAVKELSAKYHAGLFDVQNAINSIPYLLSDGIHLTAEANRKWGKAMVAFLKG
jgi:lysophospholipase L1-like esterase